MPLRRKARLAGALYLFSLLTAKFWFMLVLIGQSPQLDAANRNAAQTVHN